MTKISVTDERFAFVRDYNLTGEPTAADVYKGGRIAFGTEQLLNTKRDELRAMVEAGAEVFEEEGHDDWAADIVIAVEACEFDMSCGGECAVGVVLGDWSMLDEIRVDRQRRHDPRPLSSMDSGFLASNKHALQLVDDHQLLFSEADAAVYTALEVMWYELAKERVEAG